jgi:hypothetical protein
LLPSGSRYCRQVGSIKENVALCREKVDYARAIPNQKKKGCCAVGRIIGKTGQEGTA